MRFRLIDRIEDCQPGQSLTALKRLTLGEEYLADHFPAFPVMPGVLMLQALSEAGGWLWRQSANPAPTVIVLREAKNVKYGQFVRPGEDLKMTVEAVEIGNELAIFKAKGTCSGNSAVSARLTLHGSTLAGRGLPDGPSRDRALAEHWQNEYILLNYDPRHGSGPPETV